MATLRKINGNYYAYFYDRHRDPMRKSYPLGVTQKRAAKKKKDRLEEAWAEGTFDPWNPNSTPFEHLTLNEAVSRFLEDKEGSVRESTLDQYRSKLEHWTRDFTPPDLMLDSVAEEHIRPYIEANDVQTATQAMRYRNIRAFLNWCVEADFIDESPLDQIDAPKEGKKEAPYLKPKDIDRLLDQIDRHVEKQKGTPGPVPDDDWLKEMIVVAVGTGLRRSELINLQWRDVDLDDEMIYVRNREDFNTKSGDERVVPLKADALARIREMHERRAPTLDEPVFLDSRNKSPRADRVSKRFKFYVRKAKLKDKERISFHNLRHTTGSWLAMKGVPMQIIQKILGHSSIQVTERYSHLQPDVMAQAMEKAFGDDA